MYITIASNPTVDLIYTNEGVIRRYGGPIYYVSKALRVFNVKIKAVGVASLEDIENMKKELNGVELYITPADVTTTFLLDYRSKPRVVKLLKKPSVGVDKVDGDVVILSPVYDELKSTYVSAKVLAVDLQGYLRAGLSLPHADLIHFSYDDLQLTLKEFKEYAARWPRAVYTLGGEGAYVLIDKEIYYINSANLQIEDVTGSGDVFFAIVTYLHFVAGLDLLKAVCEASKYTAGFLLHKAVVRHEFNCVIQAVQV
ncbi:MAG: kinase [Pyrobaculum sp.]